VIDRAKAILPLLIPVLIFACSRPAPKAPPPATDDWTYEVSTGESIKELSVVAFFPNGSDPELSVDDGAEPFVRDVFVLQDGRWQPVTTQRDSWSVPSCRAGGCQIRYRFLLADAAASLRDPDLAIAHEGVIVAPPSTWLLRPLTASRGGSFRFHVSTPPGVAFASGVFSSGSTANTFRADVADLPGAPFSAFGRLRESDMNVGGRALHVALAPGTFAVGERAVLDWIRRSAEVVASYYGRFPVERVLLLVLPAEGRGFGYGKTLGNGGASILLPVGLLTAQRELDDDWMLVHEMLHLAFPSLPREYVWLEEGMATYVEPFARARVGQLTPEAVWSGLVRGLPNGLPGSGDRGLDNTHTWGRTYWGGALFCLLADLEIRQSTQNRSSLDDALRAILLRGGDVSVRWELARVLEVGDQATGVSVLRELHQKMGSQPYPVDLQALWKKVGVRMQSNKVVFDDDAPLASLRRSMTAEASKAGVRAQNP